MTLNTKLFLAFEPGVILKISSLAGVTAAAGQCLTGSRIEDILTDRMREDSMPFMTFTTDVINRRSEHGRMVGTMGRMAIIAGIGH